MAGMEEEKRKGVNPIPGVLRKELNEAQLFALNYMEEDGWVLEYIRRPLFQDVVPVLSHPDSGKFGVLESDGTLNKQPDIKIRE